MVLGRNCTCGFLPCVCVDGADDAASALGGQSGRSAQDAEKAAAKAKLRSLFAANATEECMMCMFMPCICPAEEDEVEAPAAGDDEATSVEAASPIASESFGDGEDEDEADEETDAYGRVRISSDGSESDVWIAREIKRFLKPHQVEGVKFLQSNIAANRGCILADYMGLGKTMQVVTVIYSYIIDQIDKVRRVNGSKEVSDLAPVTTIVLCPAICIPNWESEFKKWLSTASLKRCPIFAFDSSNNKGTMNARIRVLQQWKKEGGVLLMGYEMFRSLLNPTLSTSVDRDAAIQVCTRVGTSTMEITNSISTKAQKSSREFFKLLCQPGADLVVLDEGHRMKDPTSLLCQSVAKIQSKRRLVLTGYPVQNSLSEYWCMVNFAREGFLGTYEEFRSKYEKPIVEGDVARSTELIQKLKDVVLRRGQALLRKQLPPKKEWILYCKLSPIQHRLYCDFLDFYGESGDGKVTADLLTAYAALLQVMNHPDIIRWKLCPDEQETDDGDDIESSQLSAWNDASGGWSWEPEEKLAEKRLLAVEQSRKRRQKVTDRQKSFEWARSVFFGDANDTARPRRKPASEDVSTYETMILENSGKMAMLMQIIEESFACDDKVVVFSQSVPTLKIISEFLRASSFSPSGQKENAQKHHLKVQSNASKAKRRKIMTRPNRDPAGILRKRKSGAGAQSKNLGAAAGKLAVAANLSGTTSIDDWFLQIDGSTTGAKRMEYIETFSSKDSPVKLLLVSTRAGAEGINLHAANRLVLFDVSWNPSNDHQSMCRSHRIGQRKTVHVYRLVSTGTMERMIYEQQMKKVDLSTSVVDNRTTSASSTRNEAIASQGKDSSDSEVAPFSGFLQPPSAPEYEKQVCIKDSLVADDDVLVSCIQKAGHWLVDIHPVHEIENEVTMSE
uniref:Helicase ATP-binding domain-containing protein n=1 Tax=Globisporangium ultimum (strain ATCC 200006 / CBS 805.95 / DAOM BR144) TaxID=431595 RepID=K3X609_GLOUD